MALYPAMNRGAIEKTQIAGECENRGPIRNSNLAGESAIAGLRREEAIIAGKNAGYEEKKPQSRVNAKSRGAGEIMRCPWEHAAILATVR